MESSIKKISSSSGFNFTLFLLLLFFGSISYGQEELWFGTYTDDNGTVQQGRYHVIKEGRALKKVVLAPYGKPAITFNIVKNDTVQRFVEMIWPDKPNRVATLIQYADGYYAGNFEEGTQLFPMVIKEFNFQDAQLQGHWFKPSQTEIEIIKHTAKLLNSEEVWNKNDDRVCRDTGSYSLFCALYQSSIAIDGDYRHLRPAVKFVREAIQKKYPKTYDHVLVDFNNAEEITLKEVHEILQLAQEDLRKNIK